MKYDISKLGKDISPVWEGNTVCEETVMFLGEGEKKKLLYTPVEILSVRSFDLEREFVRGKDYELEDGCLVRPEGSEMPCMSKEEYYFGPNATESFQTKMDGEWHKTYFASGREMKKHQVAVTYTHKEESFDVSIPDESKYFSNIIGKLERGEDATIFFYGDSITVGANSSGRDEHEPFMPTWAELVSMRLAEKYGYKLRFVYTDFQNGSRLPREEISFGDKGVITVVNTAVGGWKVTDGIDNFEVHCELFLKKYGCDLLILGFGMNDKKNAPEEEHALVSKLAHMFLEFVKPEILLVATMLPNPEANEKWFLNQPFFEAEFIEIAKELRAEGIGSAVAPVTSVSRWVLDRKYFRDITGNNINHPNDFMIRIYAATLLKTLIG